MEQQKKKKLVSRSVVHCLQKQVPQKPKLGEIKGAIRLDVIYSSPKLE